MTSAFRDIKAFTPPLDARSKALRRVVIETVAVAGRGHLGPALSLIEIVPCSCPVTLGVNVTVMVQLAPAATLLAQLVV